MSDFFSFRTMITPVIIQILFWVGVALCIIIGIGYMLVGPGYYGNSATVYGLLILVFGPLAVRIYCEILIIFFRINETLTEIKHTLDERRTAPPAPVQPPPAA
ncbi:MAG: DUF4282 domain-containing protein [Desulfobaccales bacterium]